MLFDTDILIWVQRGNARAADLIDSVDDRYISIKTFMELLQNALNKQQHRVIKKFITDYNFSVLPLTENIGHRALIYVEEYGLSHTMRAGDALIAATAIENNFMLCTSNEKHFRAIKDLELKIFKPQT